jgi:carboxylesterase type B
LLEGVQSRPWTGEKTQWPILTWYRTHSSFTIISNSQGQAAPPLSAFNVDPNTVTVAGISSGGFMAVQLQVAYSKRIFGTAIFAGGPYYCAQDSSTTAQGYCESGKGIPLQALIDYTNNQASNGTIDPTSNIASKPIYMFSVVNDTTVNQSVMVTPKRGESEMSQVR